MGRGRLPARAATRGSGARRADAAGADRESRLLCAFLLYCHETIQPRFSKSKAAKPSSAYQMVDGVRRVHRRAGIFMVSAKRLTMIMNGITAAHVKEHGAVASLRLHGWAPVVVTCAAGAVSAT